MAKSHYSVKKRQKELTRKLKQEEKRQRKFDKDSINPEAALDESEAALDNPEESLDKSQDKVKDPLT
jgi:hypothetical protein